MHRRLLLAQLLCLMIWQATSAGLVRPLDAPETDSHGVMPSREFMNDMCRALDDNYQMMPWPLRMGNICDTMGMNNPSQGDAVCPLIDVMKMLTGYVTTQFPFKCAPNGISHPSNMDSSGKH
jgi:hypothetical protein